MNSGESTSNLVARLPAPVRSIATAAITFLRSLSMPARVLTLTTVLALAGIISYFGYHTTDPAWTTLFNNLDREDAASVVAKLKEMKTPYKLEGDGGTILVPEAQSRELRLELAGAGLPRGAGVGFESFDKMRLGATEFEQRVLYRRSLEGELSRTIDTIASVQSARVHLVLPERSVFVGRSEPSTASIVLKMRPGRVLGAGEVSGIVHLVASSVAGLSADKVAVVTTDGTVLHKPRKNDDGTIGDEEHATAARSLEATLEERARQMLEKVVGSGHVDVRVTAELDSARVERTEDHYDPKQTTLRSEQRSVEHAQDVTGASGVPGAESNLPTGAGGSDAGVADRIVRESQTRNFEVDRVTEKRIAYGNTLRRLTVAVVVDGLPHKAGEPSLPRTKEDVERISALVRSAVGADDKRGDSVTVESVPFLEAESADANAAAPPPPPAWMKYMKYAPFAGIGLAALLTFATVIAVLRTRAKVVPAIEKDDDVEVAETSSTTKTITAGEGKTVMPKLAGGATAELPEPDPNTLRTTAHQRAAEDPATAALVLRFWLGSGEGQNADADKTSSDATKKAA